MLPNKFYCGADASGVLGDCTLFVLRDFNDGTALARKVTVDPNGDLHYGDLQEWNITRRHWTYSTLNTDHPFHAAPEGPPDDFWLPDPNGDLY